MPVGMEEKPLSASSSMKKHRLAKIIPEIRINISIRPSSLIDCLGEGVTVTVELSDSGSDSDSSYLRV